MDKYRVIPLSEMWTWWPCWCVWLDSKGWHDATGSVIYENSDTLTIGNRPDHRKYQVDKKKLSSLRR